MANKLQGNDLESLFICAYFLSSAPIILSVLFLRLFLT